MNRKIIKRQPKVRIGRDSLKYRRYTVKNISLETPNAPQVFREQWKPSVQMDIANSVDDLGENLYEVTLSVTATVSAADGDKTIYLVEVQQAGVFLIADLPREIIGRTVATVCPNILFPFAREIVSDLVTRAGFPQLLLAPVNFDALYLQHQQKGRRRQGYSALSGSPRMMISDPVSDAG